MTLALVPLTRAQARRFVGEHHRHNLPPIACVIQVGVESEGELVGVGMAGLPKARLLMDGRTLEVIRTCTTGERNACSMLYGALARAAFALGYERVITYTLASEPGTSLKASGWQRDADVPAGNDWYRTTHADHGARPNLFGIVHSPPEAKVRWVKEIKDPAGVTRRGPDATAGTAAESTG